MIAIDNLNRMKRLQVSDSTLYRHYRRHGLNFCDHLEDAEVLEAVQMHCHIDRHGRSSGHRVIQATLRTRAGVRVPRQQILRVQAGHDPQANAARRQRMLHRQRYSETQAKIIWQTDSAIL